MNEQARTLGKYQIVGDLGKGGFGLVFKAYDPSLERFVALKILHPAMARDVEFVGRFTQEAKIAANLSHPNIVHIHEIGSVPTTTFIAMEYIEGKTLAQCIKEKGKIPAEEALAIIEQAASALDFAHNKGILHRDVKPSNILIDAEGHVKLTDFGLAKATTQGSAFSKSSSFLGTLQYISPEMAEEKPIDKRADIYALGLVLYEMLAGRPPFTCDSLISFIRAHAEKLPPVPSQFNKQISQDVQDVILKALEKNPDERFQTAGELAQTLKRALKRPFRPAQDVVPKSIPTPSPTPRPKKVSWIGVMSVLLLCVGGGGVIWSILGDQLATMIVSSPSPTVSQSVEMVVGKTPDSPPLARTLTLTLTPLLTHTPTPTPLPTHIPTPTPTPEPTRTPTPIPPTPTFTPDPRIFWDNFDAGLKPDWIQMFGRCSMSNGQLSCSEENSRVEVGDYEWTNYRVEFDIKVDVNLGTHADVLLRVGADGSYLALGIPNRLYEVRWLYHSPSGEVQEIAWAGFSLSGEGHFVIECQDDIYTLKVFSARGNASMSIQESRTPNGRVGFIINGAWIDNVTITKIAP